MMKTQMEILRQQLTFQEINSWMTEKFGKGITYLREISEYAKNNVTKEKINKILNVIEKVRVYFQEHNINE